METPRECMESVLGGVPGVILSSRGADLSCRDVCQTTVLSGAVADGKAMRWVGLVGGIMTLGGRLNAVPDAPLICLQTSRAAPTE